jgi:putative pyruvate formate lyase activating enzyme
VASFTSLNLNKEFSKFESLDIWKQLKNNGNNKNSNNNGIRSNHNVLPWYLAVSVNQMPAKYLISKSIPCNITDLRLASEEELWEKHRNLTETFIKTWKRVRSADVDILSDLPLQKKMPRLCI